MKLLLLAVAFTLCLCVTTVAQTVSPTTGSPTDAIVLEPLTDEEVLKLLAINTLEAESRLQVHIPNVKANPTAKLAQLYKEAAENPRLSRYLLGQHLAGYFKMREAARSAPQASQAADEAAITFLSFLTSQNAIIIEQNKRIIGLLEQMVRKR